MKTSFFTDNAARPSEALLDTDPRPEIISGSLSDAAQLAAAPSRPTTIWVTVPGTPSPEKPARTPHIAKTTQAEAP